MNTENITCECGSVFQWTPTKEEADFAHIFRPGKCPSCYDRIEAERDAEEAIMAAERAKAREESIVRRKAELVAKVADATPALFRQTAINHPKFNAAAWVKIKDHKLTADFPFLGLVGMTGRCKSRMAFLYAATLLERIAGEADTSFAFVASYEIGDAVARQFGSDFQEKDKARRFLDRLRTVDVLLVDDLGKGRLTPAVASEIFALIDHRHAHLGRTIWTSNSSPEAIAAGMPEDMAGPFAGRILNSSVIFTLK